MFARISEDNVAFSLKVNAPRIPVVLGVLRRTGTSIQDEKYRGLEESHDRAAWRVVKKRLAIEVQTTVACGRHSMKFLGPLDAFQKQKRVERSFSRKT